VLFLQVFAFMYLSARAGHAWVHGSFEALVFRSSSTPGVYWCYSRSFVLLGCPLVCRLCFVAQLPLGFQDMNGWGHLSHCCHALAHLVTLHYAPAAGSRQSVKASGA
jgi:hypothetical protein